MKPQNEVFRLARFVYTHNPFYLISTALVLYGLQLSFQSTGEEPTTAWALAGALAGYTTLLAAAGYLVVRYGKVWEDARSILLVVVLMFLAISVSFDQICNSQPDTATRVLTLGCCFAMALSELLIRALHVKLPWSYRGPYYLILGLFFVYPLWVSPVVNDLSVEAVRWRVMSFPIACSVAVLGLIPAVRRGAAFVAKNGTPWEWPWYPWPLFVFVAFCVCFRSYILTLSFQPEAGLESSFSGFYLVPFAFATIVLLLEIAIVERARKFQLGVLASAPLLVLLAIPWDFGASRSAVLATIVDVAGSPIWLALMTTAAFYVFAWLRRVRVAEFGLVVTLVAATVIGPTTIGAGSLAEPQAWPLVVLAVWQSGAAIRCRSSLRGLAGGLFLAASAFVASQDIATVGLRLLLTSHVVLLTLLIVGSLGPDRIARHLLRLGATGMALAAIGAAAMGGWPDDAEWLRVIYLGCLTGVAAGYWYVTRTPWWLESLAVNLASVTAVWLFWIHAGVRSIVGPRAIVPLTWGMVFFVVAAIISSAKAGVLQLVTKRLRAMLNYRQW